MIYRPEATHDERLAVMRELFEVFREPDRREALLARERARAAEAAVLRDRKSPCAADPDARESVSPLRQRWPPYAVARFCAAETINTPVSLYERPDEVSAPRPAGHTTERRR